MGQSTWVFLSIIVLLIGRFFRKKNIFIIEKISPFECGFSPEFNARLPFTLRFFLIAIIFDVELVLIFPFLIKIFSINIFYILFLISIFLLILTIGLFHEWNQGSLD